MLWLFALLVFIGGGIFWLSSKRPEPQTLPQNTPQKENIVAEEEDFSQTMRGLLEAVGFEGKSYPMKIRLEAKINGQTMDGTGFGFGDETGSAVVKGIYETAEIFLKARGFTDKSQGNNLPKPYVAFAKYQKRNIVCTLTRLDIKQKESSEVEVGCAKLSL